MPTPKLNYLVDILMAISFIIIILTALNSQRGGLHSTFGWIFVALVILHFLLHWKWVISITSNFFKK
ncbi:MAG: hypothetical protein NT076_03875 [Candidatus Pacearchaeota archaeon]|nr:hypothetical protein [Candidatus Pacearchaeota archaeon]